MSAAVDEIDVTEHDVVEAREEAVLMCAKICHEAVRAMNGSRHEVTLDWEAVKASTVEGVRAVLRNPEVTPEGLHNLWWQHKIATGWVFGPEKDALTKTHPLMVPYAQLPAHQRAKDMVFGSIVRTFFGLNA